MGAYADGLGRAGLNSVLDQPSVPAVLISSSEDVHIVIEEAFQLLVLLGVEAITAALP